jgi:hypothetical protein
MGYHGIFWASMEQGDRTRPLARLLNRLLTTPALKEWLRFGAAIPAEDSEIRGRKAAGQRSLHYKNGICLQANAMVELTIVGERHFL